MVSTLVAEAKRVTFEPTIARPHIRRVGLVGQGEVVRVKIWPALHEVASSLDGVVVCSLEPRSHLDSFGHLYAPAGPDGLLPLDFLEERGFLARETLWLIATPSDYHPHYTAQLAGLCRVAIEKPLAATSAQARRLLAFARRGFEVFPIDHKLFNAGVLAFLDELRMDPSLLERVRRIEGIFLETGGLSNGRQQEDCIADVQWHLLMPSVAGFKIGGARLEASVDSAQVATHQPDPAGRFQAPTVWTASRLQGSFYWDEREIPYDFRQAKGSPKHEKFLRLLDGDGRLLKEVDMNETGWRAHARVLAELLKPAPDMRHTLADAIAGMDLVDAARALASEEAPYPFGDLPAFLA